MMIYKLKINYLSIELAKKKIIVAKYSQTWKRNTYLILMIDVYQNLQRRISEIRTEITRLKQSNVIMKNLAI